MPPFRLITAGWGFSPRILCPGSPRAWPSPCPPLPSPSQQDGRLAVPRPLNLCCSVLHCHTCGSLQSFLRLLSGRHCRVPGRRFHSCMSAVLGRGGFAPVGVRWGQIGLLLSPPPRPAPLCIIPCPHSSGRQPVTSAFSRCIVFAFVHLSKSRNVLELRTCSSGVSSPSKPTLVIRGHCEPPPV